MLNNPTPDKERSRLMELERYRILDTLPEQAYDDIVALAAQICDVPIALMSLVDDRRQWIKSKLGIDVSQTDRQHAFCAHALGQKDTLVIKDAQRDERFAQNPLVTGDTGIRFYAGAQLRTSTGAALGTLCVIDRVSREITPAQQANLEALARQVMAHLELRLRTFELEQVALERDRQMRAVVETKKRYELALAGTRAALWDWDIQNRTITYSARWLSLLGYTSAELSSDPSEWLNHIHPADRNAVIAWGEAGLKQADKPLHGEYRMRHKDGHDIWLDVRAVAVHDPAGTACRAVGTVVDITRRKVQEAEVHASRAQLQKILDYGGGFTGVMTTKGTLIQANEAALKEAGLHIEDVLGRHLADTYWFARSPEVREQLRAASELAAAGEEVRFDCEVRVSKKSYRTLDLSIRPIFDASGNVEFLVPSAIEITARKELEDRLHKAKDWAESTLESIGDAVITTNVDGIITALNPVAVKFTKVPATEAIGKHIDIVFNTLNEVTRESAAHPIAICLSGGVIVEPPNYLILERADGTDITINASGGPIRTATGETAGAVMTFRDVTARRQIDSVVAHQASFDSLTDLPNRREFHRRLELMFDSSKQGDVEHALCYIDLDRFKIINDACGHAAGDALLVQLSEMMQAKIRQRDTLARLGGDEFALLLGECPLDRAVSIATDLKNSISELRFCWGEDVFNVGASVGVTPITKSTVDIETLLSAADSACYEAKKAGRNQVKVSEAN